MDEPPFPVRFAFALSGAAACAWLAGAAGADAVLPQIMLAAGGLLAACAAAGLLFRPRWLDVLAFPATAVALGLLAAGVGIVAGWSLATGIALVMGGLAAVGLLLATASPAARHWLRGPHEWSPKEALAFYRSINNGVGR
ncbi:MAG: hypothetical protein ABR562_00910 [Thermoplasmatota archaeon]|nr:hypothetical protein [Halobacteriales archaeon]